MLNRSVARDGCRALRTRLQRLLLAAFCASAIKSDAQQLNTWWVQPNAITIVRGHSAGEFDGIAGIAVLPNGALVVAEQRDPALHFFDARGAFIRTVGRRGRGPGEFMYLYDVVYHDSTIYAVESGGIAQRFDTSGRRIGAVTPPPATGVLHLGVPRGFMAGGANLVLTRRRSASLHAGSGVFADTMQLLLMTPSGITRQLGIRTATLMWKDPQFGAPYEVGFSPRFVAATSDSLFCEGNTAEYRINCHKTNGELQFTVVQNRARQSVSPRAKRELREARSDPVRLGLVNADPSLVAHRKRIAAKMQFAAWYPAFDDLLLSQSGELWVAEYSPARTIAGRYRGGTTEWTVFSRVGSPLAKIQLPVEFWPRVVTTDRVIGVSRDQDDVETVRTYALYR